LNDEFFCLIIQSLQIGVLKITNNMLKQCTTDLLMDQFMSVFSAKEILHLFLSSSERETKEHSLWILVNLSMDTGAHRQALLQAGVLDALIKVSL
jgi:hypothetical protein